MRTVNGRVRHWNRYSHRGVAELDSREMVDIDARNLGAARRRPEWMGPFKMHPGDRAEFIVDDDNNIVDVVRSW